MTEFVGTIRPDIFLGTADADSFFMQLGGDDDVDGAGGNDGFYFGNAFNEDDRVVGGLGTDTLALQGFYAGLALGEVRDVEILLALSGADTRFGDTSGNLYSYTVSIADANVAAGALLTIQAADLRVGENLNLDGSAETDGAFRVFAGRGMDVLVGGEGSDGFLFGADGNLTGDDRIDGGAGVDSVALRGNYLQARTVQFQASSLANIEVIVFLSGRTTQFGGVVDPLGFSYNIVMADGNVAAGARLDINASGLQAGEHLYFSGAAETDGAYRIFGGADQDTVVASAGNDLIYLGDGLDLAVAGAGADLIDGGGGSDLFIFAANLTAADTVIGGAGDDNVMIGGRTYTDADFTNLTSIETFNVDTVGHTYYFGEQAEEAGMIAFYDVSGGANTVDLSGISRSGIMTISGGAGGDAITLANVSANNLMYGTITDSGFDSRDTIFGFMPGFDHVDVRYVDGPVPLERIEFRGNVANPRAAEAALDAGDGNLDVVFDSLFNLLWFNLNDDDKLDANDMSLFLWDVTAIQPGDVYDGSIMF